MSAQKTLFDGPTSKTNDPITSYEAAESIRCSGKAETQRSIVLRYLRKHGPATSGELGMLVGGDRYCCHRRLPELVVIGLVERTGYRRCRVTKKRCLVWSAIKPESTLYGQKNIGGKRNDR